ncbi:MAG: alpha/beta fold hydrolase [Acidimicrobiales bacterium]
MTVPPTQATTPDGFSPAALELVVERLANGRLEVLPGLGHFGPLEQPSVVADSVIRALDTARA